MRLLQVATLSGTHCDYNLIFQDERQTDRQRLVINTEPPLDVVAVRISLNTYAAVPNTDLHRPQPH